MLYLYAVIKMKCAKAVIEKLKEHGVSTVFGYPGANIAPIYDELSKSGICAVMSGNEQFSAMEAAGFSAVTGSVGVCFVTSGPGAANMISGIANAWADSVPLVVFSGQVPLCKIGTDAFQEADITGAAAPFLKYSYLVKEPEKIGQYIDEAFFLASTGRCGPVLIDIPSDIQEKDIASPGGGICLPGYKFRFSPDSEKIAAAAKILNSASRPVILAGGGAKGAANELEALGKLGFPVALTMNATGLLPPDEYNLGMAGIYGTPEANSALKESDAVLIVGARTSERTVNCDIKNAIHIDIDKAELSKNVKSFDILSDAREALSLLIPLIAPRTLFIGRGEEKRKNLFSHLAEAVAKLGVPVSVDVGQNMIFALRGFEGKRPIASAGLGSMGFSVPAAIGAAAVSGSAFAFTGDGGFNMALSELFVIAQNRLNVKIAVLNNSGLGMIYELQELKYNKNHVSVSLSGMPDLKKLAESYGFGYARLENEEGIPRVLSEASGFDGGFIIDVVSDIKESAF